MLLVWVNVWEKARLLRFATLLAMASAASGCIDDFDHPKGYGGNGRASGYACEDLCDDGQGCDGDTATSECRSQCTDLERVVRDAGCQRVWDEVLDCAGDAPNTCDAVNEVCAGEFQDFALCVTNYCSSYPQECDF